MVAIASAIIAIFSFYVNRKAAKKNTESVESILVDMDSIHAPYEKANQASPTSRGSGPPKLGVSHRVASILGGMRCSGRKSTLEAFQPDQQT
jgi:hypothetical protein